MEYYAGPSDSIPPDIKILLRAQFRSHCGRRLRLSYAKYAIERSDVTIVAVGRRRLRSGAYRSTVSGFLTMSFGGKFEAYINIVCSASRQGKVLMAAAETVARERGLKRIFLHALPSVRGFYPKLGYRDLKRFSRMLGHLQVKEL